MKEIQDKYIYKSSEVALLIAAIANRRKIVINATKLQKLLFIVYGSFLSLYNLRLLDEKPQCWPYGPVFPKLREDFLAEDFSKVNFSDMRIPKKVKNDHRLQNVVDFVFNGFGLWSAGDLSAWCLNSLPCKATPDTGQIIDDDLIRTFFNSIINK